MTVASAYVSDEVASQARSGAEFLATRGYRGLEVRKGEDAPAVVVEGREGVASGFSGEGGGP